MAQNLRKRCVSSRRVIDALARYGRAREGILYYLLSHQTQESFDSSLARLRCAPPPFTSASCRHDSHNFLLPLITMDSSTDSLSTPAQGAHSSRSTKIVDDATSLTSFNPFSEEDEHDQSSYALVSSIFSKVKNTLSAPLSSAGPSATPAYPSAAPERAAPEQRRPSLQYSTSNQSNKSGGDRSHPFSIVASNPAPPLVSLTPVVSETPSYAGEYDRSSSRGDGYYGSETPDGGGYAIPGFPIQDSDARSIRTNVSLRRSASVSKVIRRIQGEGVSRVMFPFSLFLIRVIHQVCLASIGWMTNSARNAMTARASSPPGDASTIAGYAVCGLYLRPFQSSSLRAINRANILLPLRVEHHQRRPLWTRRHGQDL